MRTREARRASRRSLALSFQRSRESRKARARQRLGEVYSGASSGTADLALVAGRSAPVLLSVTVLLYPDHVSTPGFHRPRAAKRNRRTPENTDQNPASA